MFNGQGQCWGNLNLKKNLKNIVLLINRNCCHFTYYVLYELYVLTVLCKGAFLLLVMCNRCLPFYIFLKLSKYLIRLTYWEDGASF